MATLLWQKPGVAVDANIQAFLAADDVLLDREFFLYDIAASTAHAQGLQRIGILSPDELDGLLCELEVLATEYRNGAFVLDAQYEDGHSAIESRLTERLGDTGRKIHTGRSRNDQILVATRLWLKDRLAHLGALNRDIAQRALQRAAAEQHLPMPGYTHLQRAVVSSAGMWWAGWAEAFIDNAVRAADTLALIDCNPLGTAAGYGVNIPLDRAHTTAALGFARLQVNPISAQLSRGKFELAALEALGSATLDLRRIAWDLSLFTSSEFAFIALPPEYSTGSSIMPNKRNPDVIELMRATHASVAAARTEIEQLLSLPSGYHRDLQSSKGAVVRGFSRGLAALQLLPALLSRLEWREASLRAAIDAGMYATDAAIEAAVAGVPFREAYQIAATAAGAAAQGRTPEGSLTARVSPGAAADLCLDALHARWQTLVQPTSMCGSDAR
ncbi:argininosuccinate lyase [Xylella taiwanensis]|uniref:Argininosuccinate lyase n=1 Tax=Xylella taiwanensis TaxID=1444770 RepID=Z9JLC2_9GAMM|nr:argininosuccinate lyase [Xylella taiwanensis]AXI82770.1 argininosuccinate lyase [Xylella taiwanensis]EWS78537.1 argininosuccinate lyase [Xylella taiwanensis]MCD8455777.1 argininosuccinate lyase [Xylella taiwanensis]MCD8458182.1 argininosuccinate lyase [Xylella taiwanensis]MCD8460318.1 argininosuccinate lyase [Xylella taiwanensis]